VALEYIDESSVLKDKNAVREFRKNMNDPRISKEGAELLARARKRAENLKDPGVIIID
jgi:hypothetical protein